MRILLSAALLGLTPNAPQSYGNRGMSENPIDYDAFRLAFDRFRELVEARSGYPFRSFDEGLAAAWENYKPKLRDHALGLLSPSVGSLIKEDPAVRGA